MKFLNYLFIFTIVILIVSCQDNKQQNQENSINKNIDNKKEQKQISVEYTNILKESKKILNNKSTNEYEAKVVEATISNTGIINLSLKLNALQFNVFTMMGSSGENTLFILTLDPIFKSSGAFFKKYPDATVINFEFVDPKEVRDKYGNLTGNDKNTLLKATLNKSTYEKINLDYVKKNLLSSILFHSEWKIFTEMLDRYEPVSK